MKVKINCAPPPEIKWFKGDTDITKSGGYKITRDPNGFDTLIIGSASRSSAGEYEVKATNEMGTASSRCTIKVNSKYLVFKQGRYSVPSKYTFGFGNLGTWILHFVN